MSSAVDEDTAQAIQSGRETIGGVLSSAQEDLQKAFIAFVIGLMGTIWAMRVYVWDFLEANTKSRMGETVAEQVDIIVRTPFDVILLQVKLGLIVGVICAIPVLVYYGRQAIFRRIDSTIPVSRGRIAAFVLSIIGLFVGGIVYAYAFFFPFMFEFLAANAVGSGVKPSYGIVEYTEFILLLSISFGLGAQLPLVMSVLAYTEIVPYETFRDKWRYAVLGIFILGMLLSPPDPFTQVMWGLPLVVLYAASLGVAKAVTNIKRAGRAPDPVESGKFTRKGRNLLGVVTLATVAAFAFFSLGGPELVNQHVFPSLPEYLTPEGGMYAGETVERLLTSLQAGIVVGLLGLFYYTVEILQAPVEPRYHERRSADRGTAGVQQSDEASAGAPADIDLEELDAAGIEAAPVEAFLSLTEEEALELAQKEMEADNPEKAQALLDRFDEAEEAHEEADAAAGAAPDAAAAGDEGDDASVVTDTAAGMMDAFTEDETTEEDIGGYLYDIQFIVESLTSRMFRIVGVFMAVFAGTFYWLYSGGIGEIKDSFLARVPQELREGGAETVTGSANEVVAVHPVEVLIFEVKVAAIVALVSVLPMLLYYSWPALQERGLVGRDSNRNVFYFWGVALIAGLVGGSVLGFFVIAPGLISYLVQDAKEAGMVVAYRVNNFFWLIFFLTIGIGLLANIPMSMWLFHRARIVSFETMFDRWRIVTISVFVLAAMFAPTLLTMLILSIPIAASYLIGLAVLWLVTLPSRARSGGGGSPA